MVLQVVAAVEAQLAEVAGERLVPRVDEGVTRQAGLVLHHLPTHLTHRAAGLQLHRLHRCMLGDRVRLHRCMLGA